MFAVGCIQSQHCHNDNYPTGVATQDWFRQRALVVPDKAERVYNFHRATVEALAELIAAMGLTHPDQVQPQHVSRRMSGKWITTFAELFPTLAPGELLGGTENEYFAEHWQMASAQSFSPSPRHLRQRDPALNQQDEAVFAATASQQVST